jgi:hypothetical protein
MNALNNNQLDHPFLMQIGDSVDRLVTLDVLCYGVIGPLYAAARSQRGMPLCLEAAMMLRGQVSQGDTVLITTGLILPGCYPYGETDGPLGAAVLARALALGLGARVIIESEPELQGLMAALLRTAGLHVIAIDALADERPGHRPAVSVVASSLNADIAAKNAAAWFDRFDVRAVIAIERPGANASGVYHMVGGQDISAMVGKSHVLFDQARQRGRLAIGIGDRGNELGLGPIAAATRALLPFGHDCGCPCHGGVADETFSDLAIPAVISNWGAYGVAACLAVLEENPDLMHTADIERALFETARREGGVDGMSGQAIMAADGIGAIENMAVVSLLREIYRALSARDPSPYSTPLIRYAPAPPR